MTPISTARFHLSFLDLPIFSKTVEIALKISDCALAAFQALQGAVILLIPVRETPQGNNFCGFCKDALNFTNPDQFEMLSKLHGYFLLTSGALGIAGSLHEMGAIVVPVGGALLNPASLSLFAASKIFSLTYSGILFASSFQKKTCVRLSQVSKIHLLSSLNAAGYIAAAVSGMLHGPLLITALCGGIALSSGGMRIFYELFYYKHQCKIN